VTEGTAMAPWNGPNDDDDDDDETAAVECRPSF